MTYLCSYTTNIKAYLPSSAIGTVGTIQPHTQALALHLPVRCSGTRPCLAPSIFIAPDLDGPPHRWWAHMEVASCPSIWLSPWSLDHWMLTIEPDL